MEMMNQSLGTCPNLGVHFTPMSILPIRNILVAQGQQ